MRETRRPLAVLWMVICWSTVPAPSGAAPLPPGTSLLEVDLQPVDRKQQLFELGVPHRIADSDFKTFSHGTAWEGGAISLTRGGTSPEARAIAFGKATLGPGPEPSPRATTDAHTIVTYYARVAELNEPPFAIPGDALPLKLPVTVRVHAAASARATHSVGGTGAASSGRALVGGFLVADVSAQDSIACGQACVSTSEFDGALELSFLAGQEIGVLLEARARSVVQANSFDSPIGTADAHGSVDPVFSFNQEAFDEIARAEGFPTFDLTQYFAFEFSPGFGPGLETPFPAPVPPSAALIVTGVLLGAACTRARRRAASDWTALAREVGPRFAERAAEDDATDAFGRPCRTAVLTTHDRAPSPRAGTAA